MWPDEQDASSSSHSGSPTPESPRGATTVLVNGAGGEDMTVSSRPIQVAHMAYYPIVFSRQLEQMQSDLHAAQDSPSGSRSGVIGPGRAVEHGEAATAGTTLVAISNASLLPSQIIGCSKCSLKDMEIRQLQKRVQALEEQLCRAIGTKKITVFEPAAAAGVGVVSTCLKSQPPAVAAAATLQSLRQQARPPVASTATVLEGYTAVQPPIEAKTTSSDHHSADGTAVVVHGVTKVHTPIESQQVVVSGKGIKGDSDEIELVPGTNVFISTSRLQQILSIVKTGKQLARKLMSVYWDRMVLAKSTLSAASQHYEQLDPNIISAIKTYCVLFDGSARKSEIHSTMIDKCVQARRPRRSSLKQQEMTMSSSSSSSKSMATSYHHIQQQQEIVNVSPPPAVPQYIVSRLVSREDFDRPSDDGHTVTPERPTTLVHQMAAAPFIVNPNQLETNDSPMTDEESEKERVLTSQSSAQ